VVKRAVKGTTSGPCDLSIRPQGRRAEPIVLEGAFTFASPSIEHAPRTGLAGDEITVSGAFFGTRKGQVFFLWSDGARTRRSRFRPRSWSMDPLAGASEIVARVPEGLPTETTGQLVVQNRLGSSRVHFHHGTEPERSPPVAKIRFPPPSSLTDADRITVTGTAADATAVTAVRVNGVTAITSDGFATWRATVPLGPGVNPLVVTTEDRWGNADPLAAQAAIERVGPILLEPSGIAIDAANDRALVVDPTSDALIAVDLATGERIALSGGSRGTGPEIHEGIAVALDPDGERALLLQGYNRHHSYPAQLLVVDLETGDRTDLPGGPGEFIYPLDVAYDPTHDRALILDLPWIYSIALASGETAFLSGEDVGVGAGPGFGTPSAIAVGSEGGHAYVTDSHLDALLRVDLVTGDRAILSGEGAGTGPRFSHPLALALEPDERFAYVADTGLDALFRVDLTSGDREILSDGSGGTGPDILFPSALDIDPARGSAMIADRGHDALLVVDPDTGGRTAFARASVGSGPTLEASTEVAFDTTGHRALVIADGRDAVMEVDLARGERALVWHSSSESDVLLDSSSLLSLDVREQRAWAFDYETDTLYEIDLRTGRVTVVTSPSIGVGPLLRTAVAVGRDPVHGGLLVVDRWNEALLSVDPITGDRTVVSDELHGVGQGFRNLEPVLAIDIVRRRAFLIDRKNSGGYFELVAVDLSTGDRTVVSESWYSEYGWYDQLALDPGTDRALIIDAGREQLLTVDLSSGDLTVVSDSTKGMGPRFSMPTGVCLDRANNRALVVDPHGIDALFAVDLATGDRVIVSR
jgi:DNA-binding beta-propeller fold protein YncE